MVEADVLLAAPFNGTLVTVVANTTAGANRSAPFKETLVAQYRPSENGSTADFSSYYGSFVAAVVNSTSALNVTLTVKYGGISASGFTSIPTPFSSSDTTYYVIPGSSTPPLDPPGPILSLPPVIPLVLGTPTVAPTENMSATNGATACPAIGASWEGTTATCTIGDPTVLTNLTIGEGVTVVNDVFLDPCVINVDVGGTLTNSHFASLVNFRGDTINNYGTIINDFLGAITNEYGGTINNLFSGTPNGFVSGKINNNLGTIYNYGGTINNHYGTINNGNQGTIINYGGGTIINNGGAIYNHGIIKNLNSGTIINELYTSFENYGTIDNSGVIRNMGRFTNYASAIVSNTGSIDNSVGTWIGRLPSGNPLKGPGTCQACWS